MEIQLTQIDSNVHDLLDNSIDFFGAMLDQAELLHDDMQELVDVVTPGTDMINRRQGEYKPAIEVDAGLPPEINVTVSKSDDDKEIVDIDLDMLEGGLLAIHAQSEKQTELLESMYDVLDKQYKAAEKQRRKDALRKEANMAIQSKANQQNLLNQQTDMGDGLLGLLDDLIGFDMPGKRKKRRRGKGKGDTDVDAKRRRSSRRMPDVDDDIPSRRRKRTVEPEAEQRRKPKKETNADVREYGKQRKRTVGPDVDAKPSRRMNLPTVVDEINLPTRIDADFPDNTSDAPKAKAGGKFGRAAGWVYNGIRDNLATIAGGTLLAGTGALIADSALTKYGMGGLSGAFGGNTLSPEQIAAEEDEIRVERERLEALSEDDYDEKRLGQIRLESRERKLAQQKAKAEPVEEDSSFLTTGTLLATAGLAGAGYAAAKVMSPSTPAVPDTVSAPNAAAPGIKPTVTPDVKTKLPVDSKLGGLKSVRAGGLVGSALDSVFLYQDVVAQREQEYATEEERDKGTAGLLGRFAGKQSGALAGAAAGAAIGSVVPLVGTAIGGLLGSVAGYFAAEELGLADLGEKAAEKIYDVGADVLDDSTTTQNSIENFFKFGADQQEELGEVSREIQDSQLDSTERITKMIDTTEREVEEGGGFFSSMFNKFSRDSDSPAPKPTVNPGIPNTASNPPKKKITETSSTVEYGSGPRYSDAEFDKMYREGQDSDQIIVPRSPVYVYEQEDRDAATSRLEAAVAAGSKPKESKPKATAKVVHGHQGKAQERSNQVAASTKPTLATVPLHIDDPVLQLLNLGQV
jgi:gas vesicle protein